MKVGRKERLKTKDKEGQNVQKEKQKLKLGREERLNDKEGRKEAANNIQKE